MNYYGLETEREGLVCDWKHDHMWFLEKLKAYMDINTIRLPFSYQYITTTGKEYMDAFIDDCTKLGIDVILDYHRTWSSHQGPNPEEGISMEQFIQSWVDLLARYTDNPRVVGVGIFNEIQSKDDFEYTNNMHRYTIEVIENHFPDRFVYFAGCPGWGGNCSLMDLSDMPTWNRTFIEVHKYIFSGDSNVPDWDTSIPSSITSDHWFVGETGWKHGIEKEREWAEGFLAYLKLRNITNVCGWTIAHSGDTEGWWSDDCDTFNWPKAGLLASLWRGSLKRIREGRFSRYNNT